MTEVIISSRFGEELLVREPVDGRAFMGVGHICVDASVDATNPFVANQYEFDSDFYRGTFNFESPLTGEGLIDTPETFGRHRVVAALLDSIDERNARSTVLDLGCGTLDIARIVPDERRADINLINADISGPWSSGDGLSSLERGTRKLLQHSGDLDLEGLLNVQYNFNESEWPFGEDAIDFVISNMAFHHVAPELKRPLLEQVYDSIRSDGSVIFTDVFNKDETGAKFTNAGLRGPDECGGYMVEVSEFVDLAREVGFEVDDSAFALAQEDRNHQTQAELEIGKHDPHSTIAINKAIWFMELRKS